MLEPGPFNGFSHTQQKAGLSRMRPGSFSITILGKGVVAYSRTNICRLGIAFRKDRNAEILT